MLNKQTELLQLVDEANISEIEKEALFSLFGEKYKATMIKLKPKKARNALSQ